MVSRLPPPPGFLLRTRQRWRYQLPAAAFVATGIALMLGLGRGRPYLLLLAVLCFALMATWARCPRCRTPVVGRVLVTTPPWKWVTAVLDLRQCPRCGFHGGVTS